jgi:hypothetical protein
MALVLALAFAACGEDRFAAERGQVEELMPNAEDVRCTGEPRRAVECEGTLNGNPLSCEFRYEESAGRSPAYSGSSGCWSEPKRR